VTVLEQLMEKGLPSKRGEPHGAVKSPERKREGGYLATFLSN